MLLYDLMSAQPSGGSKFHGGGEYIKSVFSALVDSDIDTHNLSVCYNSNLFLDPWLLELINEKQIATYQVSGWNDISRLINNNVCDTFFSGLPRAVNVRGDSSEFTYIGVIHGLRPIERPYDIKGIRLDKPRDVVKGVAKTVFKSKVIHEYESRLASLDIVIAVSAHTKYAIENIFGRGDCELMWSPRKHAEIAAGDTSSMKQKYILLIGCNRWEKNPVRAIQVIDQLFQKNKLTDYTVECVGIEQKDLDKIIKSKLRFTGRGYVSPELLETLYRDCDIFFYPTLNEGFGYPPSEVMRYGKTCVVSGVCSLTEVYGDAVYYVNPYDYIEMQGRLLQAVNNKIDSQVIKRRMDYISHRQEEDLDKLVSLLVRNS